MIIYTAKLNITSGGFVRKEIGSDEGFRSRIAFHVKFDKYSTDGLIEILKSMANDRSYILDEETIETARDIIDKHINDPDFGNGRFVRTLLERAIMRHSSAIMNSAEDLSKVETHELTTIVSDDIIEGIPQMENKDSKKGNSVGFNYSKFNS